MEYLPQLKDERYGSALDQVLWNGLVCILPNRVVCATDVMSWTLTQMTVGSTFDRELSNASTVLQQKERRMQKLFFAAHRSDLGQLLAGIDLKTMVCPSRTACPAMHCFVAGAASHNQRPG